MIKTKLQSIYFMLNISRKEMFWWVSVGVFWLLKYSTVNVSLDKVFPYLMTMIARNIAANFGHFYVRKQASPKKLQVQGL